MNSAAFYDELVGVLGSDSQARKVVEMLGRSQQNLELTDVQRTVYNYISSGRPLPSLRQMAKDCGLNHPQILVSTLSALVLKGYLVPKGGE